ncbi:MAG: PRC-barrel domain-containing protein, partial [Bacillota bacterium]
MLRKLSNLKGFKIHGRDDDLGKAKDFYFDQHRFIMRYLVVDTGNWLKHELTLISTDSFKKINYENNEILVDLSSDELEEAPGLEDLFVDEENWAIRYLLIDTRNILPGKDVLIAP